MNYKYIIFFLILAVDLVPASLSRLFSVPKRYVLNLQHDVLGLKFEKESIMRFINKHPFVSLKIMQEILASLTNAFVTPFFCTCGCSRFGHVQKAIFNPALYNSFLSFFLKYDENCNSKKNPFSFKSGHPVYIRLLHAPTMTFLTYLYALLKGKSNNWVEESSSAFDGSEDI